MHFRASQYGPMAPISISEPSQLLNPLVSSAQLETSASQLDGVPRDLEGAVRFETARLMQAAGILLRLRQEIIAQAIVTLQRFWTGPEGGSLLENDAKLVAAACLYLTAKSSSTALSPRQVLTAIEYLSSLEPVKLLSQAFDDKLSASWSLSEGQYEAYRTIMYECEAQILRTLGFQTHVALPHTLLVNYLQTLDLFQSGDGTTVAKAAFAHLNSALLSPQMLYLTHQPSALTTAAIYLAARETGTQLPEIEWWEVFDVDREELGFLVVALRSVDGFARAEKQRWTGARAPMCVEEVTRAMERS